MISYVYPFFYYILLAKKEAHITQTGFRNAQS